MLAGCTGYIYWYMRAHWAFVGTGESQYGSANKKNQLLPRAYVMSHFSKYVTGSTRLTTSRDMTSGAEAAQEYSAYMKGDSIIVMAIDTTKNAFDLKLKLPLKVRSGTHVLSTANESLCKKTAIDIDTPTREITVNMPPRSLNTYIFIIDNEDTAIHDLRQGERAQSSKPKYFDLQGRRLSSPQGICIEQRPDGSSRKVFVGGR